MQFNTKRGLVDIPNEEIIAAARTLGLSAGPTPDQQGHCERSRLATGWVPASSVQELCGLWDSAALAREEVANQARRAGNIDDAIPLENGANAYKRCSEMLRAELARATERQPAPNNPNHQRAGAEK